MSPYTWKVGRTGPGKHQTPCLIFLGSLEEESSFNFFFLKDSHLMLSADAP